MQHHGTAVPVGGKIDWLEIEAKLSPLYADFGRLAMLIWLLVGLHLLKHMYNLGDETVVKAWVLNPYYQFFTRESTFQWNVPLEPSDMVHFRKRIGDKGLERILAATVKIHGKKAEEPEVIVDSTVEQTERLTERRPTLALVDLGYQGVDFVGTTKILRAGRIGNAVKGSAYYRMRKKLARRSSIEPGIGHMKARFRLGRNYLAGIIGDSLNAILMGAAWNLVKWMNGVLARLYSALALSSPVIQGVF